MHILIVEDEQRIAYLLRRVLLEERHTVDLAHDGYEGLDLALSDTYDAVILDVMLPGIDGIEVCRQMRAENIMTPVLMLTARGAVEDRVTGLNVGADDYLTKPFAMEELLARVNALLRRRDRRFDETLQLSVGDLTLDLVRHEARRDGHIIELTAKEFALLEYLMRHAGRVLTRTQIVDAVWRYDLDALSNEWYTNSADQVCPALEEQGQFGQPPGQVSRDLSRSRALIKMVTCLLVKILQASPLLF